MILFLKVLSENPQRFCIKVETSNDDDWSDVGPLTASLQFTFTSNYPEEAPLFELIDSTGFLDDSNVNKINDIVDEQVT